MSTSARPSEEREGKSLSERPSGAPEQTPEEGLTDEEPVRTESEQVEEQQQTEEKTQDNQAFQDTSGKGHIFSLEGPTEKKPGPNSLHVHKLTKQATTKFNLNPKKSMQFLIESGLISHTPADFVEFMLRTEGLSKRKIGEFLAKTDDFNQQCLKIYMDHFDFAGEGLDDALRELLRSFRLPGEAQQIDRILEAFATRYYQTNASTYSNGDTVFILSFSLIMLNTDLHNRSIASNQKMTLEAFINTNRGIDGGKDLPAELLEDLYNRIKTNEIRMDEGDMYESQVITFIAPKMSGWLWKKSENFMGSWRKHWFVITDNCLYYFSNPSDTEPRCIIPMENVRVGRTNAKREFVITPSKGHQVKSVKKADDGRMTQGSHREFVLRAADNEERERWVVALQSELTRNPAQMLLAQRRASHTANNPEQERVELPPPIEQGWIRKRGDFNPAWRRRYCVLFRHDHGCPESGPVMYYYGSKELAQRMIDLGEQTHKGYIFIGDVERVNVAQERAHLQEVAIELITSDRTWTIMPDNQEAFTNWLSLLSDCVANQGAAIRKARGLTSPAQIKTEREAAAAAEQSAKK